MSKEVSACAIHGKDYKIFEARARAGEDPGAEDLQLSAEASANVFHIGGDQKGMKTAEMEFLGAKAGTSVGVAGPFVGASAHVIDAKASMFDMKVGVAADTGSRIIDESVQVQILGTGVTLGRKVGISVLGSSFGVDLGRIFGK